MRKCPKKKSYIIVSRQAVHLHQSTLWVQNKLSANQHVFRAFVPWTPQLEECLQADFQLESKESDCFGKINEKNISSYQYLSEHLREVIDICSAKSLSLEAFGLQQVFGHIGSVDQHAMQRTLFVSVRLEGDLQSQRQ